MQTPATLALIPARGGSKSIPRKNIRPLGGHPLLAYSVAAGLAAQHVHRVIVSTDDEEIAEVAQRYGAQVPFTRPAEFSQDETPDLPVFQHALHWLEEHEGYRPEIIVQLRPTSPFRRVWQIDRSIELLVQDRQADAVRTVIAPFQNPYKMWRIADSGYLEALLAGEAAEPYNLPRQQLPPVYWQTGYVDAARRTTLMTKDSMTGDRILPLITDPGEWIDIDSEDDWRWAERLLASGELSTGELGFSLQPR